MPLIPLAQREPQLTRYLSRFSKKGTAEFTVSSAWLANQFGSDYKKFWNPMVERTGLVKVEEHTVGYYDNNTSETVREGKCARYAFPATLQAEALKAPIDRASLSPAAQESFDVYRQSQFGEDDDFFSFSQASPTSRTYSWVTRLPKGVTPIINGVASVECDVSSAAWRCIASTLSDATEIEFHQAVHGGYLYEVIADLAKTARTNAKFALNKTLNAPSRVVFNKSDDGFVLPLTPEQFEQRQCKRVFKALFPKTYKELRSIAKVKGNAFHRYSEIETMLMNTVKREFKKLLRKRGVKCLQLTDYIIQKHDALFVHPDHLSLVSELMDKAIVALSGDHKKRGYIQHHMRYDHKLLLSLFNTALQNIKIQAIRETVFVQKTAYRPPKLVITEGIRKKFRQFHQTFTTKH